MKRIALITGASSGIGEATARRLAQEGYKLIITGRRLERLEALAQELRDHHGVEILALCFDVRSLEQVEQYLGNLPQEWQAIDVLINNAGLAAGLSPIHEGHIDEWERMIDTNIKGLLYVTRTITPGMKERQRGHIINISSIAGREVYPNGNVYCGTKHAVQALGQGIRLDLLPWGIKVTQICPGAVETEFSVVRFDGDQERAKRVYDGFTPLTGEDIADTISYVLSVPEHVNISEMLVMPTAQASTSLTHRQS